jgi:hypothetical protein
MVTDIQEFKKHMHTILPDGKDFRNKFQWEEKLKNIASILGVELSIRKEIDDSLKNEIILRNKMIEDDNNEDDERSITIKLARMISNGSITLKQPDEEVKSLDIEIDSSKEMTEALERIQDKQ